MNSKSASDLSEDLFKVHDFDVKIDLQVPSSGRFLLYGEEYPSFPYCPPPPPPPQEMHELGLHIWLGLATAWFRSRHGSTIQMLCAILMPNTLYRSCCIVEIYLCLY